MLQLTGADDAARHTTYDAIKTELTPASLAASGVTARVGGTVPMEVAINSEVTADIAKAEGFSMPVLLILLMVIFGSLAAASLPVAIGGVAILGSFTVLRLLTMTTTVSIYSVNITTILGLGLAIDYGLFMVTRFREELHRQPTVEQAVARTVATAGRTVAVSVEEWVSVHGLRGVPAVPDPRTLRPDRRQHRLGGQRPAADRRPDYQPGAAFRGLPTVIA